MRSSIILIMLTLLMGCDHNTGRYSFQPVLPALPAHWYEILGEPLWQIEWINEDGVWQRLESAISSNQADLPQLSLPVEWTTPILAWPFWPDWDLPPGAMQPSGALFPWDAAGNRLSLSWKAGVDAVFWKELAAYAEGDVRFPWYFDWPRFRELLDSEEIPEELRQDLWLADWKGIAEKTTQSGFDRRRIVSRKFTELLIPDLGGRWIGSSPFAAPLDALESGLKILAWDTPDTWVSSEGDVLKCAKSGWVLRGAK
jgi:hypothetical protein